LDELAENEKADDGDIENEQDALKAQGVLFVPEIEFAQARTQRVLAHA
jgi:hypothetical protein